MVTVLGSTEGGGKTDEERRSEAGRASSLRRFGRGAQTWDGRKSLTRRAAERARAEAGGKGGGGAGAADMWCMSGSGGGVLGRGGLHVRGAGLGDDRGLPGCGRGS